MNLIQGICYRSRERWVFKGRTVDIQGVRNNQKLPYPYVEKQRREGDGIGAHGLGSPIAGPPV